MSFIITVDVTVPLRTKCTIGNLVANTTCFLQKIPSARDRLQSTRNGATNFATTLQWY